MESIESKEKREIKQLSKDFRGMKERFKTSNQKEFKNVASLFLAKVYNAYQINDIVLNETVKKSYNEVYNLLMQRISNNSDKLRENIFEFLFIIEPVMDKFIIQAGKLYD